MTLFGYYRNSDVTTLPSYNWQNDRLKFEESQIREMPSWITTNKKSFTPRTLADQNIDVRTFSDMQKHGYNIIKAHSEQPFPKDPLLLIIIGWWYRKKLPN